MRRSAIGLEADQGPGGTISKLVGEALRGEGQRGAESCRGFPRGGGWCHNDSCPLRTGRCGDADERSLVGVDLATLFGHTIDEEIDVLVVERDEARNFCAIRNRHCVRPSDVVALDLAFVQAPVARKSFLGAAGALVRGLEEVHAQVGLRHVIANRYPVS